MAEIMMYEGYGNSFAGVRGGRRKAKKSGGSKRRKSGSQSANRKRFGAASKACFKSTTSWPAFGKCMRKKLKK